MSIRFSFLLTSPRTILCTLPNYSARTHKHNLNSHQPYQKEVLDLLVFYSEYLLFKKSLTPC